MNKWGLRTWEDFCLTCKHGVKEHPDYHDCPECRKLTIQKYGPEEPTHVFLNENQQSKTLE